MTTIAIALGLIGGNLAGQAGVTVQGSVQLSDRSAARYAVVWLEGDRKSKPGSDAVVDQRDLTFIPHVSVVTAGTRIQFPNHDTVNHNVFAEFEAKRFDLGMYPRGASRSVKFDRPGLVAVLCSVHSDMSAYVMVVDTPYHAVANRGGTFSIRGVEPGEYVVRAWQESGQTYRGSLRIGSADVELSLRVAR